MRLRASHPLSSRLTVSAAQAMLEEQEEQMTMLADAQSTNQRKAAAATQKLSEATRELERLRMERAKKEEEVRQMKVDKEEDEKVVVKLIDWCASTKYFNIRELLTHLYKGSVQVCLCTSRFLCCFPTARTRRTSSN